MKSYLLITAVTAGLTLASGAERKENFDGVKPGRLPRGWVSAMTHDGGAPKWEVLRDGGEGGSKVLAQTSTDDTNGRYPLAVWKRAKARDGELAVRFKAISGKRDQAAGLVWRYQDKDNYYIVRANALENNVVLYKVEQGRREALAPVGTQAGTYGVKHEVKGGVWNELKVRFVGNRFTVWINGVELMAVEDSTFGGEGTAGVWTKADSVTYFDDFRLEKLKSR